MSLTNSLTPRRATYQSPTMPQPRAAVIQAIEISGLAQTERGWVPFNRVRLNPAQTRLSGQCTCPVSWQA